MTIDATRIAAADEALEEYDFGERIVLGSGSWEMADTYGTRLTRSVSLTDVDDPAGPSVGGRIDVDFADLDGAEVVDVQAYVGTEPCGHMPSRAPSP